MPMDSYRLGQMAVQVPCYICSTENTANTELCRQCFAPMALANQAANPKEQSRMVAAIGGSGVGKTVYLGMLMDMLSRQPDRMQITPRSAFSLNLQQATASALSRGEFPAKTPTEPDRWNWVHCQVRAKGHKHPVELIMPDMAGEALLEEVDHPDSYQAIRPLLSKCSGVLILMDTVKLQAGSLDEDYFTMKLLSYLASLDDRPKQGWGARPVAFVLTKADECEECFVDPGDFAKSRAPGLWRQCQERFHNHRFFATGAAGGFAFRTGREGRVRVPLRIEPRGILEPFEWLINQVKG